MTSRLPDIRKTVEIDAPVERVWEAVATAKGLAGWLMENDFQPAAGCGFTLTGPYGPVPCRVLEIDPPRRLSFSWDTFGWRVSFQLEDIGGRTRFTVIHSGWGEPDDIVPRSRERNANIRDIMDFGWEHNVKNLRDRLGDDEK